MNGVYYLIREIASGRTISPAGVSKAPHLYLTHGKANGIRKQKFRYPDLYEVVAVQLTEIKEGTSS